MDRLNEPLPIEAIVTSENDRPWQSDAVSALVSLCIHLAALLLLALLVFPSPLQTGIVEITMGLDAPEAFELDSIEIAESVELPVDAPDELSAEPPSVFEPAAIDVSFDMADLGTEPAESEPKTTVSIERPSFSVEALETSSTVEGAFDRITSELRSKLEKDDLLIVWLLDASHSLVDDRPRVAARLTPFYENLVREKSSQTHLVRSAVVSFGSQMRERIAPTTMGRRIVNAVEDLPIDRSGTENVFDAVIRCAGQYRRNWDKQISIVIWTDESGDDAKYLQRAIDVCRERNVSVSIVGPSSVLGGEEGLHSYIDPKSGGIYPIPVQLGPDAPRPERLELGYWFVTPPGYGGFRRGRGLPSWMGGQDLAGILSGFSPYALTRLAAQTGGSYTIFDRKENRGPFDPVLMREYAPSYQSIQEYDAEIDARPVRIAVMRAVGELRGKRVDEPTTMFFTKKTGDRYFDFMRYYYPPREFQTGCVPKAGV